jgi:fibronectin type 3 domain-containing protein
MGQSRLLRRRAEQRGRQQWRKRSCLFEILEARMQLAVDVTTYHGDSASTGQYLEETVLTPTNVNVSTFGKLYSNAVDGQVYAQPLMMSSVIISGVSHSVAYVATEHNSVYAFDVDTGALLWKRSFIDPAAGITSVPSQDVIAPDISPETGITGTPVIDPESGTLYVIAKTKEVLNGVAHYFQRMHALDITNGSSKFAAAVIGDTIFDGVNYTYVSGVQVAGTGVGSVNGVVTFNALRGLQRPALTLANGVIYAGFASHGDNGPYHGWLIGYNKDLTLASVFNASPYGSGGGIWQSGGKIAVDAAGALYFETGNGSFDIQLNASGFPINGAYGNSMLKMVVDPTSTPANPNINGWGVKVVDYFTPFNQAALDSIDKDLGSVGPVLLPAAVGSAEHPNLIVGSGKEGVIYVWDANNLGKYDPNGDHVVTRLAGAIVAAFDTPAYYNGTIYFVGPFGDNAKAFSIANGVLNPTPTSISNETFGYPGSTPVVSANGNSNAILWTLDRDSSELRAYRADNLGIQLYTSAQALNLRDALGPPTKFAVPIVANGKVMVGTMNSFVVYGLLPPTQVGTPAAPSSTFVTPLSGSTVRVNWTDNSANESGFYIEQSTDGQTFVQIGTAAADSTDFWVGGLQAATNYTFRVRAYNVNGSSAYSGLATGPTTNPTTGVLDYFNGFATSGSTVALNGSAVRSATTLSLTNNGISQAGSAFDIALLDITRFTTQFDIQITNPQADGMTFTLQGMYPYVVGPSGGGLGYSNGNSGIIKSAAIKFDLFSNLGETANSTGLYLNGAPPFSSGSVDLSNTAIDLKSGHPFRVTLTYDGTTLVEKIVDLASSATATVSYTVDLPSAIGSNYAYGGFTAATGGLTAAHSVQSWLYQTTDAAPPTTPSNLLATAVSGTQVTLTWSNTAANGKGIYVERALAANGNFSQVATLSAGSTSFTNGNLNGGTEYLYRLRTVNTAGVSSYSATQAVMVPQPPVAPTNVNATIGTTNAVIRWTENSTNADGFRIYRKTGAAGTFELIFTLPAAGAGNYEYNDTALAAGRSYDYHIQAYNIAGYSDFGGISITTLPVVPANVVAGGGPNQATVFWNLSPGATSYNIYRGTTSGGEGVTPIATGVTGSTYVNTGLADDATYYYQVTAVNAGGETARSAETSVLTYPAIPTGLVAAAGNGQVTITWNASPSAETYNIYRSTTSNGQGLSPIAIDITGNTFTDSGMVNGTTYYYKVTAVNDSGENAKSSEVVVTPVGLNFANGFAGSGSLLTFNGVAAKVVGTQLQLTDGGVSQASSVFSTQKIDVTRFATQFNFQLTNPNGDGFTFLIQGVSPTAVGPNGGALGYSNGSIVTGITKSVAIKFDLYNNQGETNNSTGLYTNAAGPFSLGSIDLTSTGINLHTSGRIFAVDLMYDGGFLRVTITDTVTNAVATHVYTVNIPSIVGGNTAYVGFTGGTGGATARQVILNWKYSPAAALPNAPTGLSATPGNGQATLAWSPVLGATSYNIYRSTSSLGEGVIPIATGVTGTSFINMGLTIGTKYYYQVTAVSPSGEGPKSAEQSATPAGLDFSAGFAHAATLLQLNGASSKIVGTALQLTDGGVSQAASAFTKQKLDITRFTSRFDFQLTNPNGDGFTFIIQGVAATAIGPNGGALGYSNGSTATGITKSVAIKFDLYSNQGESNNSTGLYVNAAAPFFVGSIDLTSAGINLHSGRVMTVNLSYDGTVLTVTITDNTTNAVATQNYTVNIANIVGGTTAFLGFTGGTGGATARQNILNWTYTPTTGLPLLAAGAPPSTASSSTPVLTSQALAPIVQEAILRWQAAGIGAAAVALLKNVNFQIVDLNTSGELGLASSGFVQIDDNGGNYGWFVDPTPKTDVEYATKVAATELKAAAGSAVAPRMDLLTVVLHELGHELGLTDVAASATAHGLMTASLSTGIRRLPAAMTAAQVTPMKTTRPQPLLIGENFEQSTPPSAVTARLFASYGIIGESEFALEFPPAAPTRVVAKESGSASTSVLSNARITTSSDEFSPLAEAAPFLSQARRKKIRVLDETFAHWKD